MDNRIRILATSSVIAVALAACSAGSTLPASTSSTSTAPVSQSVSLGSQTAGTAFAPSLSSATLGSLGLTSAPAVTLPFTVGGNGTATIGNTLPSGVTALSAAGPKLADVAKQSALSVTTPGSVLFYFTYTPTTTVSVSAGGGYELVTILAAAPTSTAQYAVAFFNSATSAWVTDSSESSSVSGNTITINGGIPVATTLSAGTPYTFAIYAVSATGAATSPTPGASATGTASATPTASPTATASATATASSASGTSGVAGTQSNSGTITVYPLTASSGAANSGTVSGVLNGKAVTLTLPLSTDSSNQTVAYSFMTNLPSSAATNPGDTPYAISGTNLLGYVQLTTENFIDFQSSGAFGATAVDPNGSNLHLSWYGYSPTSGNEQWLPNLGTASSSGSTLSTSLSVESCASACYLNTGNQNTYVAYYDTSS